MNILHLASDDGNKSMTTGSTESSQLLRRLQPRTSDVSPPSGRMKRTLKSFLSGFRISTITDRTQKLKQTESHGLDEMIRAEIKASKRVVPRKRLNVFVSL